LGLFRDEWSKLLETVELRDEKLVAAGEIHRFNRDVAESLSRIQEKYVAIPDDLGRDLNSVLGLIRRHENFETDLVALEAQLQVCFRHNSVYHIYGSCNIFSPQYSDPGG
jgi:spectrin beta